MKKKKLVIIVTQEDTMTTTEFVGDLDLYDEVVKSALREAENKFYKRKT